MPNRHRLGVVAEIPGVMAAERGTDPALVFGGRVTTHAQLHERSSRCAQGLLAMGVRPGDRVAVYAKDSDELFEVIFGIAKARAVQLSVNWRLAEPEIRFILEDSGAVALFVGREFHETAARLRAELPGLRSVVALTGTREGWPSYRSWRDAQPAEDPKLGGQREDVFTQMYTSGTTGTPKGVQLANRSFFAIMDELDRAGDPWVGWREDDVTLHNLPSCHIVGMWLPVQTLTNGGCLAIMEQWSARDALRILEAERVSKAFFVPAMIQMMLLDPECAKTDFSNLDALIYGGSPMAPALLEQSLKTFACPHFQIYGLTETGNTATSLRAEDHLDVHSPRIRSAGRPYDGVRLKVIDREGKELGPRAIGEICIHSPANMVGYWHRDEATRETLRDGWLHTGDAGYLDEDGYVYVCDRIKEMIIVAGENIYPAEIEAALRRHPAVAEVAVFGIPDDRWGERVTAAIILNPGAQATVSEIQRFAKDHLADFKIPSSISFVDSLPRTSSGKVQKVKLREPYWKNKDRRI